MAADGPRVIPPTGAPLAWTPPSRTGIAPLHPLGFGTILGRSFTALRHNPRVLLGFAVGVQAIGAVLAAALLVGAGVLSFSRLAALQPGTDEFDTVMAGAIALVGLTGVVVTVASTALGTIVQGVVVADVARGVVAERLPLRRLWSTVRPAVWRLIGYGLLVTLALLVLVAVVVGVFILASLTGPAGFLGALLAAFATIPLWLWLSTKLMLVPAVLVLEGVGIRAAVARSWRLIRGRFWVGLGVTVIVNAAFGTLAQVVSVPLSLASTGLTTVVSPTGDVEVAGVIAFMVGALVTQLLVFLLQCISLVALSTAATLVYVDTRMRREALDLELLAYVDARDAGRAPLPDPYEVHPERPQPAGHWGSWAPSAPGATWAPPAPGATWAPPAPGATWAPPAPGTAVPLPAPGGAVASSPTQWTPPGGS